MKEMRRNMMVGLFVLFGLTALCVLIVLFGRGPTWLGSGNTYALDIHFDSVSGIRPGTLVTLYGKTIGRVQEVGFRDAENFIAGVKVVAAIESQYRLPRFTRAETVEAGLGMGRPPIEIIPGPTDAEPLPPGEYIKGETRSAVESIFPGHIVATFDKSATQIGEAAAAMTPVLEDLHEVMRPRTPQEVDHPSGPPGNLSSAMTRFDSTLKHFNTVLGDPEVQSQVKDAVANFHKLSEDGSAALADIRLAAAEAREVVADAKVVVGNANTSLDKLNTNIDTLTRSAVDVLERAGKVLDPLYTTAKRLASGEGTLGKLTIDDRLYEAMVLSFRRLGKTAEEFELLLKQWQKEGMRIRGGL